MLQLLRSCGWPEDCVSPCVANVHAIIELRWHKAMHPIPTVLDKAATRSVSISNPRYILTIRVRRPHNAKYRRACSTVTSPRVMASGEMPG